MPLFCGLAFALPFFYRLCLKRHFLTEIFSHAATNQTSDSIPFSGWVLSAGKEGQPLSFLSRIRVSNRIPFRLPIPELWFSVLGLCFALWQFVFLQRLRRQRKDNHLRNFLIRYIHNQNGETYRQVLF